MGVSSVFQPAGAIIGESWSGYFKGLSVMGPVLSKPAAPLMPWMLSNRRFRRTASKGNSLVKKVF